MDHPKSNRHLHLIRVRKYQAIIRTMPGWIQAERIHVSIRGTMNDSPIAFWEVPSRVPNVKGLGEYVVVHKASVDREHPHQKNDVPPTGCVLARHAPLHDSQL
jgi:hypothetical protein